MLFPNCWRKGSLRHYWCGAQTFVCSAEQSFPQLNEPGVEGWREKNRRQRNKCAQECAHGTHQCTGQTKIFVRTSPCPFRLVLAFLVLAGYVSLVCRWFCYNLQRFGMWCCVVVCDVKCNNAACCDMTWGEVIWLVARCHVMWCGVMSWNLLPLERFGWLENSCYEYTTLVRIYCRLLLLYLRDLRGPLLDSECANACAFNGLPGPMRHCFTGFTHLM